MRRQLTEEPHVVPRDALCQTLGRRQLAERNLKMIRIVKTVEQIPMERMNVVQAREALDDSAKLLADHLLRKLDLAGVEGPDSADLETATDLGGQLAMGGAEDDVDELVRVRDLGNVLPPGRGLLAGDPKDRGWIMLSGCTY